MKLKRPPKFRFERSSREGLGEIFGAKILTLESIRLRDDLILAKFLSGW